MTLEELNDELRRTEWSIANHKEMISTLGSDYGLKDAYKKGLAKLRSKRYRLLKKIREYK
jgi:hypothetical protein